MRLMKAFLVFTCFQSLSFADTYSVDAIVMERASSQNIVRKEVTLTNLKSSTHFDGEFVKIVRRDTDELIPIDPSGQNTESLRAATAYYQINKARLFFKQLGIEQTDFLTVRIGIRNLWHRRFHFQNERLGTPEEQFNNAHTHTSGEGIDHLGIQAWGKEIWLRDPLPIEITEAQQNEYKTYIRNHLPDEGRDLSFETMFFMVANAFLSNDPMDYIETAGSGLLQNFATNKTLRWLGPEVSLFFISDTYHLDAAMIPEVIIHEYIHFIMSDHIPTVENTAIMEGMSDFFTTEIMNHSEIAHDLGAYGELIRSRDARDMPVYDRSFDTNTPGILGTSSAYMLSILFRIHAFLSEHEGEETSLKIMFDLRKHLGIDSKIHRDFPRAIMNVLNAARAEGKISSNYRLSIMGILFQSGL